MENSLMIRDMSPVERPRERLRNLGASALKAEELLANIIRSGYRGVSALDIARSMLAKNPLSEILDMPFTRLAAFPGVGPTRAAAILSARELVSRVNPSVREGMTVLQSVGDVAAQAVEIRDKKKEYLLAFFLNARHELICKEVISIGTLTASLAHPREIFAPAIGKATAGIILVHNHPSGNPSPSDEDVRLTKRIAQAGMIMGIELLDHLIVAESGCYSFKTSGQL